MEHARSAGMSLQIHRWSGRGNGLFRLRRHHRVRWGAGCFVRYGGGHCLDDCRRKVVASRRGNL